MHAIAAKHGVHPVQVSAWKKEVAERLPAVFSGKPDADAAVAKEREKELFDETYLRIRSLGPGRWLAGCAVRVTR